MPYNTKKKIMNKYNLTFDEFVSYYFTKTDLYYIRARDGYRMQVDEVDGYKNYYNRTGEKP